MAELEILTVTYAPDLELFEDLHASIARFTDDQVVHRVVVDDADRELFERFHSDRCQILGVRETLPKTFVKVPTKSLMINLRHPWPPVRGWIFQQLVKLSMAERSDADVLLLMDSDVVLTKPVDAEHISNGWQTELFPVLSGRCTVAWGDTSSGTRRLARC